MANVRKFDVKLGASKNVQFIFYSLDDAESFIDVLTIDSSNPYSKHMLIKGKSIEQQGDVFIVRQTPEMYDSFAPGKKKPQAIFRDGRGNPPAKQIVFNNWEAADAYKKQLNSMGIFLETHNNAQIELRDKEFILRTNEKGVAKISAVLPYFENLEPYKNLLSFESEFKELLEDFKNNVYKHYENLDTDTIKSLTTILGDNASNAYISYRKQIEDILHIIETGLGEVDQGLLGNIANFAHRTIGRNTQSSNFYDLAKKFDLRGKIDKITDRVKNPPALPQSETNVPFTATNTTTVLSTLMQQQPHPLQTMPTQTFVPPFNQTPVMTNQPFMSSHFPHPQMMTSPFVQSPFNQFQMTNSPSVQPPFDLSNMMTISSPPPPNVFNFPQQDMNIPMGVPLPLHYSNQNPNLLWYKPPAHPQQSIPTLTNSNFSNKL